MTNEQFCKIVTDYYGEEMDNINQLTVIKFNGEELKEFIEFAIQQTQETQQQDYEDEMRAALHESGGCVSCGDISGFNCICEDEYETTESRCEDTWCRDCESFCD